MMFLLLLNITLDGSHIRVANSKSCVTTLPGKISQLGKDIVHPSASIRFQIADDIGQRSVWTKLRQNMDMIFDAVYA